MEMTHVDAMETLQDRLTSLLRRNRAVFFCDGCLALKTGEFPRDVRQALAAIERRESGMQVASGQCSECLRATSVVRVRAA